MIIELNLTADAVPALLVLTPAQIRRVGVIPLTDALAAVGLRVKMVVTDKVLSPEQLL